MRAQRFYPIIAGTQIPNDWHKGKIPSNIEVGENSVIDSSFCFERYFANSDVGLRIGNNVTLWRASLSVEENGYIEIGHFCYICNASIVCSRRITIGSYVWIAGGVTITDSDFHPIDPAARLADTIAISPIGNRKSRPAIETGPVYIEDDVWVGYNATILKGVRIGSGAVIAPGAIVINNVPQGAYVAGNPARLVKGIRI